MLGCKGCFTFLSSSLAAHDTAVAAVANMAGNLATLTEYGKEAARDLMGRSGLVRASHLCAVISVIRVMQVVECALCSVLVSCPQPQLCTRAGWLLCHVVQLWFTPLVHSSRDSPYDTPAFVPRPCAPPCVAGPPALHCLSPMLALSHSRTRMHACLQPTYDVLFKGLRTRFRGMDGAAAIDLEAFGRAVSRIMYDVPTFRPYWGLMDLPPKEKKARQAPAAPRVKDSHVLERPQEVVDQESHAAEARNATRSSDIFAAIHRMLEPGRECLALKVQCDDGEERRVIPMVQALFDPFSYSQTVRMSTRTYSNEHAHARGEKQGASAGLLPYSAPLSLLTLHTQGMRGWLTTLRVCVAVTVQVENLFYFSFLVKHKMAAIHVGKLDSAPYIYAFPADSVTSGEGDEGEAVGHSSGSGKGGASSSPGRRKSIKDAKSELSARQFVLQLDPDAWEKVCAEAGLTAPRLPHRKSRDSKAPEGYAFHQDTFTKAVKGAGASAGASATSASKRKAAAAPAPSPDSESEPEEAAPTAKRTRKV